MTAYIITRTFEVPTSFENDLLVTDIVGCTSSEKTAKNWLARAKKKEIYLNSEFDIIETELDTLPELSEEGSMKGW